MTDKRTDRELEVRSANTRQRKWKRPETLPTPKPQDGYVFRWVRLSSLGEADPSNVSSKLREGWQPCKAKDHPELVGSLVSGLESRTRSDFKDGIIVGGLMLCKADAEMMQERSEYYSQATRQQMETVKSNLARENDPRMPLSGEMRSSSSSLAFGTGE